MNRIMQEQWSFFEGMHGLRTQLLDSLSDNDLAFTPGGQNITLGVLCREIGEIDHSYIQSLQTFKQDWSYRNTEAGLDSSVAMLKLWYDTLYNELKTTLEAFSDEDLQKTIDRGFSASVELQLQAYLQAVLIFFGKVTVYLKAMNKPIPQQIQDWIG